jgi:hypothetical protein
MKLILSKRTWCILAVAALFLALPHSLPAASLTVLVVPVDPLNPTFPHTAYPTTSTTEASIVLGATVPSAVGSTDSFTYSWNFGDGTSQAAAAVTNPYDISAIHAYPASAATGTAWTAVVTVKDTTTNTTGTANYYVIQEANNLNSRVNVAIDWGLWYMHGTMWRNTTTAYGGTINWGGWDTQNYSCNNPNNDLYGPYDCNYWGSLNAENVQAFEVSGHLGNGPATDPYTDDVARGLARMTSFLAVQANSTDTFTYNPATSSYTCADGSVPQTTDAGACTGHGGQHQYNPSATSCTSPPCTFTYDGNKNGQMIYSADGSNEPIYTTSPFLDALVASGTPSATAQTGPTGVIGQTYQNIVQDILDYYGYAQYGGDCDVSTGFYRGYAGSCGGGAWLYDPQEGDDDSTSQWAAIGFISGSRGFGLTVPPSVKDFNNVWVTNAQDVTDAAPTGGDPFNMNDNAGAYGYRGSFAYSNEWGPFAVTPSGMVQMSLDGIGRTTNTAFGDASTAFDQRWNNTETFYADNFCNTNNTYGNGGSSNAYVAPRSYVYGMYSFTKSMLLHDPSGTLTPIQFLRTQTPGVFPGNSTTNPPAPKNTIDWYAAVSPANGGTDPCDGVAQTLVDYQQNPAYGAADGHWWSYDYNGDQYYYETAWAIIMLRKTVFVTCITNLQGRGTPKGLSAARIDLTWAGQTNATSYNVLRSSTNGGPYVQIGTSTGTAYSDRTGLLNGDTYYYVVQPVNGSTEICQSNQATVTVP